MDEGLWSTRNIAEYAYCPRLFYLMEVEGLHLANQHTEEGKAVHRRVDQPSRAAAGEAEGDPNRPQTVRSLSLTSASLRLTATLDIAEIEGQRATPVEYRKGRPRRAADEPDELELQVQEDATAEPWPTDRAQIALQAYLLREAGFEVSEGIIYYASEKRKLKLPITGALIEEGLAVYRAAVGAASGPRPMPLIRDERCGGCSLQPLCLPDEILAENEEREAKPRVLWPAREEGTLVVAQSKGTRIGVRGMSLRISPGGGEGTVERPLASVATLAVVGNVSVSTQALQALAEKNIPVAFLSAAGRLVAMMDPLESVSASVRRAQALGLEDGGNRLELARAVICAKIRNQRTLILRNARPAPGQALNELEARFHSAATAEDIPTLMGHEGRAANVYFAELSRIIRGDEGEEFARNGRKRRPAPDPVNACLSMAYTMLAHECVSGLRQARLEPTIGALHVSRPGRPALALDLMEPFRPLVADSLALGAFNRKEFREGHFLRTAAGCVLSDAGRRIFFQAWARRMETEVTHPYFRYRMTYRRMIVLHARMVAAWLLGEAKTLNFLMTR
jgi:CRISPR-associated protein Cas1